MNPLSIRARNYRTFDEFDLDLPAGVIAITGPNGAGKSSLVNVIDLALFGPEGRSWAPYLAQGSDSTELMLELTFEHGGETYRVRRGYSARGRGKATLDLEMQRLGREHGGNAGEVVWDSMTRESIDQTEKVLELLLGLTRETFRASSFLVQGDGAAFTEAVPRDRKRILQAVLGLERYELLLAAVRRDRKIAEADVERLTGILERVERDLESRAQIELERDALRDTITALLERGEDLTTKREAGAKLVESLGQAARERATAAAALAEAKHLLEPIERRARLAEEARSELGIVSDELASLTTDEQRQDLERRDAGFAQEIQAYSAKIVARQELERDREMKIAQRTAVKAQSDDLMAKAVEAERKREELRQTEEASCERCGQPLRAEARESVLAKLAVEAEEFTQGAKEAAIRAGEIEVPDLPPEPERPTEAETARAGIATLLQKARQDELQRSRLEERKRLLSQTIADKPTGEELAEHRAQVKQATAALEEIPPVGEGLELEARRDLTRIEQLLEATRSEFAEADQKRAVVEANLKRIDTVFEEAAGDRRARGHRLNEIDRLAILERAYGRDGIPAMIVENAAIPSIEAEAGRILAELGTSYRIELRTEKALAGGGTADALDVVVMTEAGERPYETFSGGERTRLNLAIRISLARLLAHRRGAESRLLAIDEPEFLDDAGTAALAGVLRGLTGDFERIYLISHVQDLRDSFDVALELVKDDDGRSRLVS